MYALAKNFLRLLVGFYGVFLCCLAKNLIIRDDVRLLNCAPSSVVFSCIFSVIVLLVCFYSLGVFGKRWFINLWTDVNNCIMAMDPVNNKGFFMNTRNNVSESLKARYTGRLFVLDETSHQTIFDLLKKKAKEFKKDDFVLDEDLCERVGNFFDLVNEMRSFVGKFARTGDPEFQRKWSEAREDVKAALQDLGLDSTDHLFAFYSYARYNDKKRDKKPLLHKNAVKDAAKQMRNFIWDGDLANAWEGVYTNEVKKHSIKPEALALSRFGVRTETIDGHYVSPVCVKFIRAFKLLLRLFRLFRVFGIKWQTLLQSNAHDLQSLYVLNLVATGKLNKYVGKSSDFYNPNPEADSDIIVGKIKPSLIEGGSRENIDDIRYELVGAYRIKAGRLQDAYEAYMRCLSSQTKPAHVWPANYCDGEDFAEPYVELSGYPMTRAKFTNALQKLEGLSFISADYQFWMGKRKWNDVLGQIKHCGKLTPFGPLSWFFDDNKTSCTPDGSRSSDPLPHNWGKDGPNPFMDFIDGCFQELNIRLRRRKRRRRR